MDVRRKAREMALQALYTMDLLGRWHKEPPEALYEQDRWPASVNHAHRILAGVLEHKRPIDDAIEGHANRWSVSRMNLIDRNILRIAAYELLYRDDIPPKVSINEAIELGKRYGTRDSRRFLNGVLDPLAKAAGQPKRSNP
jgi:N utilization substance protein B